MTTLGVALLCLFAGFVAGVFTAALLAVAAKEPPSPHTYARKHGGYQPECDVTDPKNPPQGRRATPRVSIRDCGDYDGEDTSL